MKQIRQGVFETNSSSTHVLHISNKELSDHLLDDSLRADWNGDLVIEGDQIFGREFALYEDAPTKASYVGLLLFHMKQECELVSSGTIKKDYHKQRKEFYDWVLANYETCRQNFIDVLHDQTGFKRIEIPSDRIKINGCIDHQSLEAGISVYEFLTDKEKIRNLIFNSDSVLLTGHDEGFHFWEIENGNPVLKSHAS